MAYEESLRSVSLDADASLAGYTGVPGTPGSAEPNYGKQYTFVKITGAHQVGLATAATDAVVGVLQNKPQRLGQAATVGIRGVSNVIASAAINAGDGVTSTATGTAVTSAANVLGIAITSAAGPGQVISVLLRIN